MKDTKPRSAMVLNQISDNNAIHQSTKTVDKTLETQVQTLSEPRRSGRVIRNLEHFIRFGEIHIAISDDNP